MKTKIISLLLVTFLFNFVHAQIADSLKRKVDTIFIEYDKTNSPGCALAIVKDGKIIYKRGYGMSNLEYNLAISPASIFLVASISKQFTAAAIVRLSLEGKLSLDDDIHKYLPEVPDFGQKITFNHLLHHTSGIRDHNLLQWLRGWRSDDLLTEKDILETLSKQKSLNFQPGEEYCYCNTGFVLLAVAVKKITGVSLRQYADSVFFKPLHMINTHFQDDHAEIIPNRTSAYKKSAKGTWEILIPLSDAYGSSGLYTTVEDLAQWDENFYTKQIGGEPFINTMLKTGVLNNNTKQIYASGLVAEKYKGYNVVSHGGSSFGYRGFFVRFPDERFSVIVLSNLADIKIQKIANNVADVFLKDKSQITKTATDMKILKSWVGNYFDSKTNLAIELKYKDGKFSSGGIDLEPLNDSTLIDPIKQTTFSFSGDSLNTRLIYSELGNIQKYYEKIKKINLIPRQLQEYQGTFYCPELDTKYLLTATDSTLLVKIPRNDEMKFKPLINDVFKGNFNIKFTRSKSNKIDGFYISSDRDRNLQFDKQKEK